MLTTYTPQDLQSARVLTLWEPWASACMAEVAGTRVKRFETRSWPTPYRGPVLIHAAQRPMQLSECLPILAVLDNEQPAPGEHTEAYRLSAALLAGLMAQPEQDLLQERILALLLALPGKAAASELFRLFPRRTVKPPTAGKIIGLVRLVDCVRMVDRFIYYEQPFLERAWGNWEPGRYAWQFEGHQYTRPVTYTGRQGLQALNDPAGEIVEQLLEGFGC